MAKLECTLSISGINQLQKELEEYKKELEEKSNLLVKKLLEIGVSTAYQYSQGVSGAYGTHKMENYVNFTSSLNKDRYGYTGVMLGMGQVFYSQWVDSNGQKHTDTIKPLSMLEWGSAALALSPQEAFNGSGGKGTMATQGHEDDLVWYFATDVDEKGNPTNWKIGTAVKPTQPMYHAMKEIMDKLNSTAKQVFGGK